MSRLVPILVLTATAAQAAPADFAKDVFPVLQRACFECHGSEVQKGRLRLDIASPKHREIGDELLRRIALPKEDKDAMPKRGERLSPAQIGHLRDWIAAGAQWPDKIETLKHWSYIPPARPPLPEVQNQAWPQTEIDRFILAKLEASQLTPSPEAAPEILIRRLSFDLTGLPPTPAEVDAFVAECRSGSSFVIRHWKSSLTASSPQSNSAFAGRVLGSISPAMPTPTAFSAMTCARSGPGATGW